MLRNALLAAVVAVGFVSSAFAATQQYHAVLDGKNEVPPTTSTGTGTLAATLDTTTRTLHYTLTFIGLTGPAMAAHFHGPAEPGQNAGVVVPIDGPKPTNPVVGNATLTPDQMQELQNGKWYVNVHTAANKGGEIRGQVLPGPLPKSESSAAMKPKQG